MEIMECDFRAKRWIVTELTTSVQKKKKKKKTVGTNVQIPMHDTIT